MQNLWPPQFLKLLHYGMRFMLPTICINLHLAACWSHADLQISYIVICSTLFASVCYHTIYTWYDDLNLSVLALYPRYKPTHM